MQSDTSQQAASTALDDACAKALNHQLAGRLDPAETLYRAILRAHPGHTAANHGLGMLCVQRSRPVDGQPHLLAALEAAPQNPHYWLGYLEALLSGGQHDVAREVFALARQQGLEGPAAEDFAARLAATSPGSSVTTQRLAPGVEKNARAERRRQQRLVDKQEARLFALVKQRDFAQAIDSARALTTAHPERGHGWKILGAILWATGNKIEALGAMQTAARLLPLDVETHLNLGTLSNDLERLDEAETSLKKARELNPNLAAVHIQLGNTYQLNGRYDDAEMSIRSAVALEPADVKIGDKFLYSTLLFILCHKSSIDADALFAEHCHVGAIIEAHARAGWPHHANDPDPQRRLRIGFVSGDLRSHVVAQFVEPVLACLAACGDIELHAYYNHPVEDAVSRRLRESFLHWNAVPDLDDTQLAKKIMADQIDILVDLSGHTSLHRLRTFARKPAPIQASWLGYVGTTGLRAMDYYISDRNFLPRAEFEDYFTEKLVHLPAAAPFQPYENSPPVNELPASTSGMLTFGSFNRLGKISPGTIALWSALLRSVPDARLIVGAIHEDRQRGDLLERFAALGIAAERLAFHLRSDMRTYLAQHHDVDICLDTQPWAGGTTTNHALWMGVPTLTVTGPTPASRLSAGLLAQVGLEAFVAANAAEFVAKGTYWAAHLPELAEVRAGLRARCELSPVRRPALIANALEMAFRRMWRAWCAGRAPESFEIAAEGPLPN